MDNVELATWIRKLISENKLYKFYKSRFWIELRDKVMREGHYECAHCMRQGIYKRAEMVHHVNEVRKRPDLALTEWYVDPVSGEKRRNLVPLCNLCHEFEHDRFAEFRTKKNSEKFSNEERW